MTKPPPELFEFLRRYDSAVQSLALGLRRVVHEEMGPCHECIFDAGYTVALNYSSTGRVIKDGICIIAVYTKHVNLVFNRGAELEDAHGVLLGSGKQMRHITVKKLLELDRPEIRAYLRQARKHAGLTRPRQRTADDIVTVVKRKRFDRRSAIR